MTALWDFFWPCIAAGFLTGGIGGLFGFRRHRRLPLIVGLLLAIASAPLWLGPLGAADRFTARVERQARQSLDHYELPTVTAHLHHGPLTRRLVLTGGQLDDWQRREVARLFSEVPGVSSATWSESSGGLPLVLEAVIAAIIGFLLGLLLAYLLELRRRYNAQWTW